MQIPLFYKLHEVNFQILDAKVDFAEMEVDNFFRTDKNIYLELKKKKSVNKYTWANVEYFKITFCNVDFITETDATAFDNRIYKEMELDLISTGKFTIKNKFEELNNKGQAYINILLKQNDDIYTVNFCSDSIFIDYTINSYT